MTLYRSFPLHIPKTLQTQKTDSIFVHWLLRYSIFCCLLGGLLVPLVIANASPFLSMFCWVWYSHAEPAYQI